MKHRVEIIPCLLPCQGSVVVKSIVMNRREFTLSAAGLASAANAVAQPAKPSIIELRYLRMRTGSENQMQRTSEFLSKAAVPAPDRAGIEPLGFFAGVMAGERPFILALPRFPGRAALETARGNEAQAHESQRAAPAE